jgi:6-bladed beta-propeller/NHL repeat
MIKPPTSNRICAGQPLRVRCGRFDVRYFPIPGKKFRRALETNRRKLEFLLLVFFFLLLAGVTAVADQKTLPAWPSPPAEPYIVYVRDLTNPTDIGARPPFFTRLINSLTGVGTEQSRLSRPFGLSLDEAGNLLVTDTGANAVCFLEFDHKKWLQWTAVGGRNFESPVAAVHRAKTFFVADSAWGQVVAFDEKGKLQFSITNALERPSGLALLGDRLVIVDSQLHQVVICGLHGEMIAKFGKRGIGAGEFNFPTHVAVDDQKQIYVTDSLNHRIQVFSADGKFVRSIGSVGDGPGHFSRPKGVAMDHAGHVYVVDAVFGNVQIFNEQGKLLLDFGQSGSGLGEFWLPNAVAINSRNEIFVTDGYNHRVQMFRYTGRE